MEIFTLLETLEDILEKNFLRSWEFPATMKN